MATEYELAVNAAAESLFTLLGRIPKYGEVQKSLEMEMSEKTFAKYYPKWQREKESLLKTAQNGVVVGEVLVPATISEAFARAWTVEVQALRTDSAAQLSAAKVAMTQDVRVLLQKVTDWEETAESLAEQLDEARQLATESGREAEQAREKSSELQLSNAVLSGRVADLEAQAREAKDSQLNTNEELKKTLGKLGGAEAKLAGALTENSRLVQALVHEEEKNVNLQSEVLALTQQVARTDDEAKRLKAEITTLRSEISAVRAKSNKTKQREFEPSQDVMQPEGAA